MRRNLWIRITFPIIIVFLLLYIFWDWDWFIPFVDARASASLGRQVSIQHLHVRLGSTTIIRADGVSIANPKGFPASDPPLATIGELQVNVALFHYLRHQELDLPLIAVRQPVFTVRQSGSQNNYTLNMAPSGKTSKPPKLGLLIIRNGSASIKLPSYKTDMNLSFYTRKAPAGDKLFTGGEVLATAKGTYAGAPVTGTFTGGALLSLRTATTPYPVDLHLQNGTTAASLIGTLSDPAHLAGADLRLSFAGQDMANLYQLTGVPIPETPPFSLTGLVDYDHGVFRFRDLVGKIGSSDLEGSISEAPGNPRRKITANLRSNRVDLTDLAGFLGGTPGKTTTPGQTAATKAKVEQAAASPYLLPHTPINLPKIKAADVDLRYRGEHIINKGQPLDDLVVHLIINDGHITVDPLNFGVGTGTIASSIDLNGNAQPLQAKANIDFRHLQLSRLLKSTSGFAGNGTIGGSAWVAGSGDSMAAILGHGDGHASLFLQNGGNVSALLIDLAGLQAGQAVLSALGVPQKTPIHCMISDFTLQNGQMNTNAFLIATNESNILGRGTADLTTEKLNLHMWTEATHLSIFNLSTPINIGGTLKNPSVLPAPGPLAARLGGAIGLGVLFPPLAIIPTIRLGLGDKNACVDTLTALREGKKPSR
ncbi:MAG: AsmA family protein [Rhodospirillales bacterium]|nr:AsmA family protein [Rhodospirillales bacterium]MDE2319583.1 AsmA family protein [Rhodospirillales bacterium]